MNIAPPAATQLATASAGPAAPWPSADWRTWQPTRDTWLEKEPTPVMQAAPIAPNADAVAQADFAYGGNYMAHGTLDVFSGPTIGKYRNSSSAVAAAQAMKGAQGIVGIFDHGSFSTVRELLVSPANRRGEGDDYRGPRPPARPRPDELIQLHDLGDPNGDWGHGDYRSLSALRFASDDLVGFVRGKDQILRGEG